MENENRKIIHGSYLKGIITSIVNAEFKMPLCWQQLVLIWECDAFLWIVHKLCFYYNYLLDVDWFMWKMFWILSSNVDSLSMTDLS